MQRQNAAWGSQPLCRLLRRGRCPSRSRMLGKKLCGQGIRTSKYLTWRRMRRNLLGVYCRLCPSERKRSRTEEGSHLSLLCQNVWRPRSVRLRQLTRLILEIGRRLNESTRYDRIGGCLGHLEQRHRCFARMKSVL